jgi:Electron transfer DM13
LPEGQDAGSIEHLYVRSNTNTEVLNLFAQFTFSRIKLKNVCYSCTKNLLYMWQNISPALNKHECIILNSLKYFVLFTQDIYGKITFPSEPSIPEETKIGKFTELRHSLKSGKIIIKDAKTLLIPGFHYDGTAPTAYFFVGTGHTEGDRKEPKTKVNFEEGG